MSTTPVNNRELAAKISEQPPTLPRKAWNGVRNSVRSFVASFMTPKEAEEGISTVFSPTTAADSDASKEEEPATVFVAEKTDSFEAEDEKTIIADEKTAVEFDIEIDSLEVVQTSVIKIFIKTHNNGLSRLSPPTTTTTTKKQRRNPPTASRSSSKKFLCSTCGKTRKRRARARSSRQSKKKTNKKRVPLRMRLLSSIGFQVICIFRAVKRRRRKRRKQQRKVQLQKVFLPPLPKASREDRREIEKTHPFTRRPRAHPF